MAHAAITYGEEKVCKISKREQLNKIELDKTGTYPSYSGGITPSGYTDDWNTHENTIIISEGGNSCGYVNFITTKFWCGGHCYALLDLNQTIKRDFLYQFLKFNELQIMKLRVGSGLPNVQKGDVENFSVKHPSFEEQTAIAQVLQTADKEISLLKAKAEKLREQKKGLMQVLLTGKVRLKNKE
jgi:type I restriction enzyme, S subunit